jgi:carbonic anhydrase
LCFASANLAADARTPAAPFGSKSRRGRITPMQKLVDGIHKFQQDVFANQSAFFERLAGGQQPLALFITCSDSRIDPNLLTQTKPGELFIMRIVGNIVPPYNVSSCGEAATIEYAVAVLGVRDIIVCGHSHCGAMNALLHPEQVAELPAVKNYLEHAQATARIIKENYAHITEAQARVTATVEENVLVQLENLRTHPSVLAAMGRRQIQVHGWVYKFETGQVFAFDPERGQFESISHSAGPAHELSGELRAI